MDELPPELPPVQYYDECVVLDIVCLLCIYRCGIDPKTCLVFLPCVSDMDELPPELPPVQHYDECVIPYSVIPPAPKPFVSMKFVVIHYFVKVRIKRTWPGLQVYS